MSAANFQACLSFTLKEEGGFSDDPADPGGATNYGITLATYQEFEGNRALGVADIQNIAMPTVRQIYTAMYWNRMRCDALPAGIDLMVFDEGVNTGCKASAILLQDALGFGGADLDGVIGPVTIAAANAAGVRAADFIPHLAGLQHAYYGHLADSPQFEDSWWDRLDRREAAALALIEPATTVSPPAGTTQ
jgi:lysozyme family protein